MAAIWKPQPVEVYKQWIKDILEEASDELNTWESNFIENLDNLLQRPGVTLTRAQAEKLESIYTEKTK